MKTAILVNLIALALTATSAMARTPIRYEYSHLKTAEISPLFSLGDEVSGRVKIDYIKQTIELKLVEDTQNLPVVPRTLELTLPIVNVDDSCGSKIYTAELGSPFADGYQHTLTVSDHRRRMCMDMIPGITVVNFTRTGGIAGKTAEARFIGNELSPTAPSLVERTEFDEIDVSARWGSKPVTYANVVVNYDRKQVTLSYHVEVCPPSPRGIRCMAELPPQVITLPITKIDTKGSCGSTFITAKRDQRPVDGILQEITLQDNRTRVCKDIRPGLEATLVEAGYNRLEGGEWKYELTFSGPALQ